MTALLVGTALAVASLCYVLYPLFRTGVSTAATRSSALVCERCGATMEPDAEFCSTCGSHLVA